ncbi:MAG: N-6 DNA methylase [Candidatus Thermoplasmatota archaeon]|jgi:hypothetical protein|nr:N-6 DNA methylase [Candidatus Thermoplasmatota archaeon]MCL5793643.1 N-6 DNA methylase [Candidatus Thermoplasmatota archaeon]
MKAVGNRNYGEHLTPGRIVREYIVPWALPELFSYAIVDMFCGEGDMIIPLLEQVPAEKRAAFVSERVWLYDIQERMVSRTVDRLVSIGIPGRIAESKVTVRDTLEHYPAEPRRSGFPVFHITNPPYMYLGYIRKNSSSRALYRYFSGGNRGLQDLYQVSMNNDSSNGVERMIYIIPSNFLYASSGSNLIRETILKNYQVRDAVVLERQVFKNTGFNVSILQLQRKKHPVDETQTFMARKIGNADSSREMVLTPSNGYRAGGYFDIFINAHEGANSLNVKYYLRSTEVRNSPGNHLLKVMDANRFEAGRYMVQEIQVNDSLLHRIMANPIYVRTLDSGSQAGRAGLAIIKDDFGVDGIMAEKTYRTHPIQLFIDPLLTHEDSIFLARAFNLYLEHLRQITDSEFMTTYKYSGAPYTRKYLGLIQAKKLISTIPMDSIPESRKAEILGLIESENHEEAFSALSEN